jgi:signal transduction histidine kinase
VPLTVQLQRRATAELKNESFGKAEAIAAAIAPQLDSDATSAEARGRLSQVVLAVAQDNPGTRVIVVDAAGSLLADSDGTARIGTNYATSGRPEILTALDRRTYSEVRHSDTLGEDILATAVPVFDEGGTVIGAVRLTQSAQQVRDSVRRTTLGLAAIGLAGLLAGMLIAFGLAGSLSRPLTRLAAAARRLGRGDLTARAEGVGGASEIVELAHSFDEMADRLERTVRAQREFVANASHQLRTPLTGMKLRLESAAAQATDESVRRQLEAADLEVDRLSEIVDRLLEMSREIEEGEPTHVDLADAVSRALGRWQERARQLEATLRSEGSAGTAQGNPTDLDQILDNLLDNAIAYARGEITIESGSHDGHVFVAVRDHGPGIPREELARVTERFYRGRGAPSGGSGLGLAIARDLAEKWGGALAVTSGAGEGTRVEVRLRPAG